MKYLRELGPLARATIRGSVWSFLFQIVVKASVIVSTVESTRILGLHDFGLLAILQSTAFLLAALWDFGYSGAIVPEVASGRASLGAALAGGYRLRLRLLPVFVTGWLIALLTSHGSALGTAPVVILAVASLFTGLSTLWTAALQSQLAYRNVAISTGIGKVTPPVLLGVVLVWGGGNTTAVALCLAAGEVVMAILLLRDARKFVRADRTGSAIPTRVFAHYAVNSLSQVLYNKGDVLMVGVFSTSVAAAEYAPASRIQDALAILPAVVAAALIPAVANRTRRENSQASIRRAQRLVTLGSLALTLPPVFILAFYADSLIPRILGNEFTGSVTPIRIILISPVVVAIAAPLFDVLIAKGAVRMLNLAFLTALAVSVAGHATLTAHLGASGGAAVSVVRDLAAAGIAFMMARKMPTAASAPTSKGTR